MRVAPARHGMAGGMRRVRKALGRCADDLRGQGRAVPPVTGKLLRPLVAWALVPEDRRRALDDRFWSGALAIQMVHEASLLHDDILDDASLRRGEATMAAREGVGSALVAGDLYLTSSYVVAAGSHSSSFLPAFLRAVEATVAGEVAQGASRGRVLDEKEYEGIIRAKSGELFAAAVILAAEFGGVDLAPEVGLRIGSLYQRVDDLLDYCTAVDQDKPALQDWRQRKWTFPLGCADVDGWDIDEAALVARLRSGAPSPLARALSSIEAQADALLRDVAARADASVLAEILEMWCGAARRGVEAELAAALPSLRQVS